MDQNEKKGTKAYCKPGIEVIQVVVESGIAISGEQNHSINTSGVEDIDLTGKW